MMIMLFFFVFVFCFFVVFFFFFFFFFFFSFTSSLVLNVSLSTMASIYTAHVHDILSRVCIVHIKTLIRIYIYSRLSLA